METELRPMNTSELLDRTFYYYRKHFPTFVGIVAIPQLALLLVRLGFIGLRPLSSPSTSILASLGILAVSLLVISVSQAATISAVSGLHLGHSTSIGASYSYLRGSLVEIVLTIIAVGIGVLLGFLLLIVPGVILLSAWSLSLPAVIIENRTPFEAMRRSFDLTRGSRFRILIMLLLVAAIAWIINVVIQLPIGILVGLSGLKNPESIPGSVQILIQVASFISSCLAIPLSNIATSLIYYDQRVRKEGFDLQVMMQALKEEHNPAPAPTIS